MPHQEAASSIPYSASLDHCCLASSSIKFSPCVCDWWFRYIVRRKGSRRVRTEDDRIFREILDIPFVKIFAKGDSTFFAVSPREKMIQSFSFESIGPNKSSDSFIDLSLSNFLFFATLSFPFGSGSRF